jgi:mannose-6-phosphate isomerase
MDPLVFDIYARPMIWGQRRLGAQLGKALPDDGPYGETWEISAHRRHVSRVAEGPLRGTLLTDLWQSYARELCGGDAADMPPLFPLLIKYLDCHERLSVQVHPSDETARRLLIDEQGKTEAWVVLDAEPDARIYAGFKQGTVRADVERHLAAGTVVDCLHSFVPRTGDCLLLRAGTVHAVGGGVLIAEVQQSSDATFRLYDWGRLGPDGRARELHVEQALASIDWSAGPVEPVTPEPLAGLPAEVMGEQLARCEYFELARYRAGATFAVPFAGRLSIWMVLEGTAQLTNRRGGYSRAFHTGECVLVPAAAEPLTWTPSTSTQPPTLLSVCLPR